MGKGILTMDQFAQCPAPNETPAEVIYGKLFEFFRKECPQIQAKEAGMREPSIFVDVNIFLILLDNVL